MKIKRLEILGFKSFVDKVTLDFGQGVTGVVGPNGCGKSNIVDAIRWVMGEQNVRHLRGRMMEDVIFGGSESRKPHGLAQVSILFDNSAGLCPAAYRDYAEIMVTRCLHRNGESEYLINKTPCRLLDIRELFMDTGVGARAYSIIEQGKVGMLVSARPEERRLLIEEAAGVTKFKARKKTALRKIDATRDNLLRLGDLIGEVRRQISSLKRQAQKAERYKGYRGEQKQLELSLAGNRYQQLQQDLSTLRDREKDQTGVLERLDARLEDGELQLEEQQLQLSAIEDEYSRAQQGVHSLNAEIQRVEGEQLLTRRQLEHLDQQREDLDAEFAELQARQTQCEQEYEQLSSQDQQAEELLEDLKRRVTRAEQQVQGQQQQQQRAQAGYEGYRSELMELHAGAARQANRREEIERRLKAGAQRRTQLTEESRQQEKRRIELAREKDQQERRVEELRTLRTEVQQQISTLEADLDARQGQLTERLEEQEDVRRQLALARSRYESLAELERNFEGYADGPRVLLGSALGCSTIAADLLRVAPDDELAVEMALGERLQGVPLEDPASLEEALGLLREHDARASLLLDVMPQEPQALTFGVPLLESVTPVAGHEALVRQLLAGVWRVERVADHLQSRLPAGVLLVDRKGNCLDWRGTVSGGAGANGSSGLLRRQRQKEELIRDIAALESREAHVDEQLQTARTALKDLEQRQAEAHSELHRLELQIMERDKDLQGLQTQQEHVQQRYDLTRFDQEQLDDEQDELAAELRELHSTREQSEVRRQQLEEQIGHLQQELNGLNAALETSRETLTDERVALAEQQQLLHAARETRQRIHTQQKEIASRRQLLTRRQQENQTSRAALVEKEQQLRVEHDALLDRHSRQQQEVTRVRDLQDTQRSRLEESRDQLRSVRSEAEDMRKTVGGLQVRQHELQVDLEHVREGVLERYRIDLVEHQVPEATDDELERQQQQLQRLQDKIAGLGDVNLMAIDEHRQQEERYSFLTQQRDDLNQSLEDLHKAINQINRTTRRRFKETFEQVNAKFQEVFPRLFRGGKAELRLSDENDLLETGIEIIVQPPGKRLQNVNLLSGGEKALTAVTLIFSLFMIKPTPFCVLDEVDAPLDDANIDRFAQIVREMTEQSQFIIITHSKRTMALLDTMYGVTMQEPGVSKLVSVRINDYLPDSDAASEVPAEA